MRIEKTKIRNLDRYLNVLPPGSSFKLISDADDRTLIRMGFDGKPASGTAVLPAAVGRTTRFNSEGKWVTRRDLPKELRYVGSRSWIRQEWRGRGETEEVEDTVDIHRWCYPRDLIEPPSIELAYLRKDERDLVVSPLLTYVPGHTDANKHIINMMLELFGACEVVFEDLGAVMPPAARRANWVMLPPGEHPWGRVEAHIKDVFAGKAPSIAKAVLIRQHVILAHDPSSIWRGLGGFSDYVAYIFKERGIVVLESVHYGNALYVLSDDWVELSKLTKAEIIRQQLAERRIVHSKGWIGHLAEVMRSKAA